MKKEIIKGMIISLSFLFTTFIWLVVYAAWTDILTRTDGTTINASIWNEMVNTINTIGKTYAPPGQVTAFNTTVCPTWRIIADGTNGTPDLRGEFIRWLDSGRWVDPGRTLATPQAATRVYHFTVDDAWRGWRQVDMDNFAWADFEWSTELAYTRPSYTSLAAGTTVTNSKVYGIRVRPRNVSLLYCVKL